MPSFPTHRPRRLRRTEALRALIRETDLGAARLIQPAFVIPGTRTVQEVAAMPGVRRFSPDLLLQEAERLQGAGLTTLLLFGTPDEAEKDETGSGAYADRGIVQQALRALRQRFPDLLLITDVCLCGYTSHGHCGVLQDQQVDNDATLQLVARIAASHAAAGADLVAPSGMVDGMVQAIRATLDQAGFTDRGILSYAVKYASGFYGPFREAAHSAPAFGDRRAYQMDPANRREALRETAMDEAEGADLLMVKPALAYLDVIRAVRQRTALPLVAYNVSGEYAMVKAAAAAGWIDERQVVLESLYAMRRAGADAIITYHAEAAAGWLAGRAGG
jgi:porphobilinogen synthase